LLISHLSGLLSILGKINNTKSEAITIIKTNTEYIKNLIKPLAIKVILIEEGYRKKECF